MKLCSDSETIGCTNICYSKMKVYHWSFDLNYFIWKKLKSVAALPSNQKVKTYMLMKESCLQILHSSWIRAVKEGQCGAKLWRASHSNQAKIIFILPTGYTQLLFYLFHFKEKNLNNLVVNDSFYFYRFLLKYCCALYDIRVLLGSLVYKWFCSEILIKSIPGCDHFGCCGKL